MTKQVIVRPRADRDIEEVFAFLRRGSPDAAARFLDAIERVHRLLGENPGIGSTRHAEICPELSHPLRFCPLADFPRILVYYLDRPEAIEVVRIWDAARGLADFRIEEPRPAYRRGTLPNIRIAQDAPVLRMSIADLKALESEEEARCLVR